MTLSKILTPEQCEKLREAGYAVVPIEPTKQMQRAMFDNMGLVRSSKETVRSYKAGVIKGDLLRGDGG
jgi:hypothetical protein